MIFAGNEVILKEDFNYFVSTTLSNLQTCFQIRSIEFDTGKIAQFLSGEDSRSLSCAHPAGEGGYPRGPSYSYPPSTTGFPTRRASLTYFIELSED